MKERFYLLKSGSKGNDVTPVRIFSRPEVFRTLSNPLGWKIFTSLSKPTCPMDLAKSLGIHEQKVYYYMRKLRELDLVEEAGRETRHGTLARFYKIKDQAFAMMLESAPFEKFDRGPPEVVKGLEPFISDNGVNFLMVVGSPDPHGPWKERALDSPTAIDLGLFLGSFLREKKGIPNYRLDTETRESDLKNNLILVGGPVANMITSRVNGKLPVYFDTKTRNIVSRLSKKTYSDDENGFISIIENPWEKSKKILVFSGKRFLGTRAAILAFVNDIDRVLEGNRFDRNSKSRVIRGYDMDGDGIIDSYEFLE